MKSRHEGRACVDEDRRIDLDVVSFCGPVRAENEDAAAVWTGEDGRVIALVADGMGGHSNGRQAAEIVVRTCLEAAQHHNGDGARALLRGALETAHARILNRAQKKADGMGATAVVALVESLDDKPRLYLAHAGDSRAYLFRGKSIYRLTRDHSLISQLVYDGHLDADEAFGHPDSNVVHRALGQPSSFEPELHTPLPLDFGDRLVLCSDGLHGALRDEELLRIAGDAHTSAELCQNLSRAALDAGSQDNVSVACIRLIARRRRRPTKVE